MSRPTQAIEPTKPTAVGQQTKAGLWALAGAVALGMLGDGLVRAWPLGLNLFVWVAVLAGAGVGISLWGKGWTGHGGSWLLVPAIIFSAAFAWRDSPTLLLVNLTGLLVAGSLAAVSPTWVRLRAMGFFEYGVGLCLAGLNSCFGALVLLFNTIEWNRLPPGRLTRVGVPVARGVLVAAPLSLAFGGLFVAADAAFENWARRLLNWNLEEIFGHVLLATAIGWFAAGWLRQPLVDEGSDERLAARKPFSFIGRVEVGIVLGALCALFLAFVVVQFRYFFGGADLVEASPTLTYAEYARRGFFELVTVAGLLLPVLLLAHWALRPEDRLAERIFRALAAALLVMLCVVIASAMQRMRLYVDEFGLTELRLYTTAFMGWLVVVFAWFAATVLRGRRTSFAFGALIAGFLAILALNLANPDEVIARVNTSRGAAAHPAEVASQDTPSARTIRRAASRPLDAYYLAGLSADAVPALIEALPALPDSEQRVIAQRLLSNWGLPKEADWRSWNWARARAERAVADHRTLLREASW